ncbi:MAG: hypothetical protein KGQ49_02010, partial [Verrucomicrobia bacterium]|nr:hypothetical protein [Verrucomicrobiota bacterium]
IRGAVERKKFHADLDRLKTRMYVLHKLAIASQTDWTCVLKKDATGWTFAVQCDEPKGKQFSPLHIEPMDLFLNGKKISLPLSVEFFASGHTSPSGIFSFKRGAHEERWAEIDLFQRTEGSKLGPKHPNASG